MKPVVGWRAWQLYQHDQQWLLSSIHFPALWDPREPVHAACGCIRFASRPEPHAAPNRHCGCGIYAAQHLDQIQEYIDGHAPGALRVYGRVSLWGHIVAGARGWRGEHAYPRRLFVPPLPEADSVLWDLTVYGVPVSRVGAEERRAA